MFLMAVASARVLVGLELRDLRREGGNPDFG